MKRRRTSKGSATTSSPFGLSRREIRAEVRRLIANGWQSWEITQVYGHPRTWGPRWS